jgi:phosphosulfolactate synthase (CoM biosynthesis protein A)
MLGDLVIPCAPGGTLFKYFYLQNKIDKYLHYLRHNGFER